MVDVCTLSGFEDFKGYAVTEDGQVYSYKTNSFLNFQTNNKGYFYVHLSNGRKQSKLVKVHRLVALAYCPNPHNYDTVDHIDENKLNNNASNLRWLPRGENKSRSWSRPIRCIETGIEYPSEHAAAVSLGLQKSKICLVLHGKRSKTGGLSFEFV